jgi:hypothetical protein
VRPRPEIRAGLLAAVAVAALPGTATAAWGPVLRPASSGGASPVALAVNASGDVAAVWAQDRPGARSAVVRALVRRGRGPARVRTLLRARDRAVTGLAAALDRRGELTVAWVDQELHEGRRAGAITVRAVHRTPPGSWSPVQAVSRTSAYALAQPRLAVAPDGTVALTFNAGVRATPGAGAAWRAPGRPFGAVRPVAGRDRLQEPALAFDMRGRAHLTGITGCDDAQRSVGRHFTATTRTRRFREGTFVAPAPATHLRMALTGVGTAAFSWIRAGCSTTEDLGGPVLARVLRDGALSAPVVLDGTSGRGLALAVATGHGAAVTWTGSAEGDPAGRVLASRIEPFGSASPAAPPVGGWAVIAGTRRGTRLVARLRPDGTGPPERVAARAGRGGPPELAPIHPAALATATSPSGGALAVADRSDRGLRVAVWRP